MCIRDRFGRKGYVLRNIYVPKNNGETSEIDVVFITQKGIFVIESKNYSGWIFGDEKSAYWTAMLPDKSKNRFYNPIKQNSTHIKWLGQYLQNSVPLFSVIAFSEPVSYTHLNNHGKITKMEGGDMREGQSAATGLIKKFSFILFLRRIQTF